VLKNLKHKVQKKLVEKGYCPFCFYPLSKTKVTEITHDFSNKKKSPREAIDFECNCGRKYVYNPLTKEFSYPDEIGSDEESKQSE
jgi:hypothetical protein